VGIALSHSCAEAAGEYHDRREGLGPRDFAPHPGVRIQWPYRTAFRDAGASADLPVEEFMKWKGNGFTLIELMIVIVIIGILCAITIPKYSKSKETTYVTTMKTDLRTLATYQESYAADSLGSYFSGDGLAQGFRASRSVTVNATAAIGPPYTWSATAAHGLTAKTCSANTFGIASCN
jgi:prepilin-type N-terminal cleavage/methylation domain-containing protein